MSPVPPALQADSFPLSHQESPEKCPYKRDFRELPVPSIMWGHSKGMAIYEAGHGFSPDTESAGTLILEFPTSRTVKNKLMLLKLPTLLDFCYSNQTKTRTLMEKLMKLKSTLLLLSRFSCVWVCVTPQTAAHQAPLSLGFSRQEHCSGFPFPSPMHESEKWKWSRSVGSDS